MSEIKYETNKEIIKKLLDHRGQVRIGALANGCVIYIDVSKRAVLDMIALYECINRYFVFEFSDDGHTLFIDNQMEDDHRSFEASEEREVE